MEAWPLGDHWQIEKRISTTYLPPNLQRRKGIVFRSLKLAACATLAGRWEEFRGQRDREKSRRAQRRAGVSWDAGSVQSVNGLPGRGESLAEFLEQYTSVTREAAVAALEEARDSLVAHLG